MLLCAKFPAVCTFIYQHIVEGDFLSSLLDKFADATLKVRTRGIQGYIQG